MWIETSVPAEGVDLELRSVKGDDESHPVTGLVFHQTETDILEVMTDSCPETGRRHAPVLEPLDAAPAPNPAVLTVLFIKLNA